MTSTHARQLTTLAGAASIALFLVAAGCAGSAGTADAPSRGGKVDAVALYVGAWEGTADFYSEGAGSFRLVLNHDEDVWTGEALFGAFNPGGESQSFVIESFAVTEEGCTFQLFQNGADIIFTGKTAEDVLSGSIEIFFESQLIMDGTFTLNKK